MSTTQWMAPPARLGDLQTLTAHVDCPGRAPHCLLIVDSSESDFRLIKVEGARFAALQRARRPELPSFGVAPQPQLAMLARSASPIGKVSGRRPG